MASPPTLELAPEAGTERTARRRLPYRSVDRGIDLVGQLKRNPGAFFLAIGHLQQHRLQGFAGDIGGHMRRIPQVGKHAKKTTADHQHHQHIGKRMNIPAELKTTVQRRNDDQAGPEINMRRHPALHAAESRAVGTLAHAEQHQPEND